MEERIYRLVDLLCGSHMMLAEGCQELGFEEDDLTDEEVTILFDCIYPCDMCGTWCQANMLTFSPELGYICLNCDGEDN